MSVLLYLVIVGLWAANAQENSMANVPKSLLECYNNTYLLDRNNKLPQNIPALLAILRKIEDNPELNMDLRTLSVALLHRFRQDGIMQNPFVPAQAGVTPYAPNGFQFHRQAETLKMVQGNAMAFPNDSISSVERCSLHSMFSSSIDIVKRGDESITCRLKNSPYSYSRRLGRRSVRDSSDDDVETLTPEQLETMNSKDETKDNGVDPNWWYPALPPNHPDSAKILALPPQSDCPVENGIIKTEWGAISGGSVLAGIAAGLEPQSVRLGDLLREEWQSRNALSSATLGNKWIATIAGDLAEVALRQGPLADKPMTIGVEGHWNSSSLPRWYFLNSNEDLFYTSAEIRGDLDGLILASVVRDWYRQVPELKLSQVIDMYYSDRGFFNTTIRACNRKVLLTSFAPNETMSEQAYRSALVLRQGVAKVTIDPVAIERFAVQAAEKLLTFIPSSMDDPSCSQTRRDNFNRISTDLTIFVDTNWPWANVQPIIASVLEGLDISRYNSNFTLISAHNGYVMINSTNSILDFYIFNETQYSKFTRGFDLPKTFDTIKWLQTTKLNDEQSQGIGGRNSEIILIVPYKSSISDTDKNYCVEQLWRLREDAPDATIMFLTHGAKDRWSDFVKDPSNDIFSVGVSDTQDFSGPTAELLSSIKRVPRRLINAQCGASYSQSGDSSSFDDYLEPLGINFYRLHPNYFYRPDTDTSAVVKIQAPSSVTLIVCSSRHLLHVNETSTDCRTITGETYRQEVNCGDAGFIHKCEPLHLSVAANSTSRCTDKRFCRFPDMVKYTFSYEDLVCANSGNSNIISPIFLVLMTVYSYIRI